MAIRNSDFNLDGEMLHSLPTGELHSKQAISVPLPAPEHRTLAYYFEQIDKYKASLLSNNVDESDEDFFDFGEEDFDENPTRAEALFESLNTWRHNRENKPSETVLDGETAPKEVVPHKEEAQAPSSPLKGSEA